MKITKLFLVAALLSAPSFAVAGDAIYDPMFMPKAGHVFSETSYGISKTEFKNTNDEMVGTCLGEIVQYGLSDNLSIDGSFVRAGDKAKDAEPSHFQYGNIWHVGATYKMNINENINMKVDAAYGQVYRESYGLGEKRLLGNASFLYNSDTVNPLMKVSYIRDVYNNYDAAIGSIAIGGYKDFGNIGTEIDVEMVDFNGPKHLYNYYLNADVDYKLADNLSIGLNLSYLLDSEDAKNAVEFDKHSSVKANVKFTF